MDTSILLLLLCSLLTTATTRCPWSKCDDGHLSPEIRFPFRIEGRQPPECGLPHFNLSCKHNTTMIHFPSYGDLAVKSISYDDASTRLNLFDPNKCVHEVFLNLNLSLTPFTYYYHLQPYMYLNCSTKLDDHHSFQQVPCLSGPTHHVYVVRPTSPTPDSCASIATVEIPFAYSPYVSDGSFGLSLTWSSTRLGKDEDEEKTYVGMVHGLKKNLRTVYAVTGIMTTAFILGKMLFAYLSNYGKGFNQNKLKKTLGDEENIVKLLQQ